MSELLHVSQISVLSDDDRRTLHEARRWVRFLWLQGHAPKLDGIEHEALGDLMRRLDEMYGRTSGEPQLQEVRR